MFPIFCSASFNFFNSHPCRDFAALKKHLSETRNSEPQRTYAFTALEDVQSLRGLCYHVLPTLWICMTLQYSNVSSEGFLQCVYHVDPCRSQTSTVRLFPQCFLRPEADCVPRAEGCIAAACRSAKPHRLYKDFKLIEELFVPLTQFQGFVSLRQDSFSK